MVGDVGAVLGDVGMWWVMWVLCWMMRVLR